MFFDFLRPSVQRAPVLGTEPAPCRSTGAQQDRTQTVQFLCCKSSNACQSSWRRASADSDTSRAVDGDKGCSGGNWSEQCVAVRRSPLRILNRSWSRSGVSCRRSATRPLGQHGESKTLQEVWRVQPQWQNILRYPATARGQASCSNGELLCGSLGAFTDDVSIQCGGQAWLLLLPAQTSVAAPQWVPAKASSQIGTGNR